MIAVLTVAHALYEKVCIKQVRLKKIQIPLRDTKFQRYPSIHFHLNYFSPVHKKTYNNIYVVVATELICGSRSKER